MERLTSPVVPITTAQIEFPQKEARKYDNYLVAVRGYSDCYDINFVLKDGNRTIDKECAPHQEVQLEQDSL